VAATTLKAALATTMQFAASLYEQVAERKGGPYYGRVDGRLVPRRTTWPFNLPGSSSQARSREARWFELNRNSEPNKLAIGTRLDISESNWNASRWRLHPRERLK
jgi:hypothetical protein